MSASSFNTIRRHSSNAADIRLKELTQELARQKSDAAGSELETDDIRSQGRMDHSTIKLNDERLKFITKLGGANTDFFYEFPTEPDFNFLKVWFMLDHLGARMRDMSGLGNDAFISGHPTLRRAGLDLGFQQTAAGGGTSATPVMLFNSGTDVVSQRNGEYIWIPDNDSIKFIQFPVGFSITFRFNCLDFNNHITEFGPFLRRFASKTDDVSNGWNLVVYPTNTEGTIGGIEMNILHNGVIYQRRTTGYALNTWYQVVVTYNPAAAADQRIKIYTSGIENSLTGITTIALPTQTNLRIGARDFETGFFYGYIHDFRVYMGKVLTQTEVTNINQNEMTIDNITKGRTFVIQYAMVSQAMRSKTHKFHVGGHITRNKIHKFNVTKKLTRTHTHRFIMVKGVSMTQTHKFTMVGFVQRTRTHRYGVGGKVILTKTHKFTVTALTVLTQVVRFQKNASGTAGATQEVTLNFTPVAIQVISIGSPTDTSVTAHYQYSHGFSDGTNHACMTVASRDAALSSDTARVLRTDSVIAKLNDTSNNTLAAQASVTFGVNKVTFTWTVNNTEANWITLFALGGTGITNAKVNTVDVGRTTTGVQSYTGLGFNPVQNESVIFTLAGHAGSTNTIADYAGFNLGCAVSTTKRWSIANASENAQATMETWRRNSDALILAEIDQVTGANLHSADFNGWITDGFQLNFTTAPSASNFKFAYLVIKGGQWDAGTLGSPTVATNNVDYAVSVNGKTPKGLMLSSCGHTGNTITLTALYACGFSDGITQATIGIIDETAQTTSDTYRTQVAGNIIKMLGANGVVADVAILDSLSSNNFRLDWTVKEPHIQFFGWVVVADK
jgi:hypothetical protein